MTHRYICHFAWIFVVCAIISANPLHSRGNSQSAARSSNDVITTTTMLQRTSSGLHSQAPPQQGNVEYPQELEYDTLSDGVLESTGTAVFPTESVQTLKGVELLQSTVLPTLDTLSTNESTTSTSSRDTNNTQYETITQAGLQRHSINTNVPTREGDKVAGSNETISDVVPTTGLPQTGSDQVNFHTAESPSFVDETSDIATTLPSSSWLNLALDMCTVEICEVLSAGRKNKSNLKRVIPMSRNNMNQINKKQRIIDELNANLLQHVPVDNLLPDLPQNETIVELTGEEDSEVGMKFRPFFSKLEDLPPLTDGEGDVGNEADRKKRGLGEVFVCAHKKTWEELMLAYGTETGGLVQLYQTQQLTQFVLTNRCTESVSSVVANVVCINDISQVSVVVLNFETGEIGTTYIRVNTCKAKFRL